MRVSNSRWVPVIRYHCDKIQSKVNMGHIYAELYCDQIATMVADLKAGKAPLHAWSGKCMPYLYWSDHIRHLQGLRLVVPPEYDPAKEYQFFMYYKMGGSLVSGWTSLSLIPLTCPRTRW